MATIRVSAARSSVSRLLSTLALGSSLVASSAVVTGCAAETGEPPIDEDTAGETEEAYSTATRFTARGTAYYPDSSALEGGFVDRRGARLRTLQQFLAGDATYVSVAMDSRAFAYGTKLRIRELERKYGRAIEFRVVDTGGAFRGKWTSRIDVCVANRTASYDATINGDLTIDVVR